MENAKRPRLDSSLTSLLVLPNELFTEIFGFLPLATAHSLGLACRRLHQISQSPIVWKRIAFQVIQLPQSAIPGGLNWGGLVLGQRRSWLARYPFEDEDPENTGTLRSDVDPDGRKEVLDFLLDIHDGSWKEVVKSFCPKPYFWGPLSLLSNHLIVEEEGKDEDSILCSKIGGTPFMGIEDDWPGCLQCGSEMSFFFQLNLSSGDPAFSIPGAARRLCEGSLVQFFGCCESEYFGQIVSDVAEKPHKSISDLESIVKMQEIKYRRIVGFRTFVDYPQAFSDPLISILFEREFGNDEDFEEREGIPGRETNWNDKVFGWPCFVQDDETPYCPMCKVRMILIFQLASYGMFGTSWGDSGIAHVFGCQECENSMLEFRWACG